MHVTKYSKYHSYTSCCAWRADCAVTRRPCVPTCAGWATLRAAQAGATPLPHLGREGGAEEGRPPPRVCDGATVRIVLSHAISAPPLRRA